MRALFDFCDIPSGIPPHSIVIRDVGCFTGLTTVTNDAEAVVGTLLRIAVKLGEPVSHNTPPIYYYDSEDKLGRLEHDGARFIGFGLWNKLKQVDKDHGRD